VAEPTAKERSELIDKLRLERGGASRPASTRRRMRLAAAAAVLAGAGVIGTMLSGGDDPVVQTVVAREMSASGADQSVLDASGYVTARREATVSAKITGKVVEVMIEEGMHVDEGALLARLDDTDARAQLGLRQACARLVPRKWSPRVPSATPCAHGSRTSLTR
jgi:multidrug efflux pump subunit AcrA (membrane-fusion protein)